MICKYCYDSIEEHGTLKIKGWLMVKPVFISFLVFAVAWAIVAMGKIEPDHPSQFLFYVFIFFENGFFWEQVYKKIDNKWSPNPA